MIIFINILICIVLSIAISFFLPDPNMGTGIISTLYTVSGIMFSIGMSLIVTSSAKGVKNRRIKNGIRKEIKLVRNHFILCFAIVSFLYIIMYNCVENNTSLYINDILIIKYDYLLISFIAYSIIYFVTNFLAIQRLNNKIEDEIDSDEDK